MWSGASQTGFGEGGNDLRANDSGMGLGEGCLGGHRAWDRGSHWAAILGRPDLGRTSAWLDQSPSSSGVD